MLYTTIQSLLAHKIRLFTTALATALGVALMAGTLVLTATVTRTFDNLFFDVYKGTDAVVRGEAVFEAPENMGDQRPRVEAALVEKVRAVDGVRAAEGGVFGYARATGSDGEALGNPEMGAPALGTAWPATPELNPYRLTEGREPRADNEIVIDVQSSKDGKLSVGDTTTVLTQSAPQQMTIVGITKFGDADSPGGATIVAFTPQAAQRLMIRDTTKFDDISVVAEDGVSEEQLTSRIRDVLPDGVEAITGEAITKESQDAVQEGMSFFTTFMMIFAIVALLVGGFMIFNTFSITVAQRTRENGLFRALGATKRQVLLAVILEALTVGVVASIVGILAGVGVAAGLKGLFSLIGMPLPAGGLVFGIDTVIVSLVAGIGITVVSAVSPARKAAKVAPVEAMHEGHVGSTGYGSKERVMVGSAVLTAGVAALFVGLYAEVGNALAVVGIGALLVFFGVAALGRTVSLPLSRFLGAPLPRLRGITGELARENAMRNPKRTAASASALMIGVALVGFITIFVSSAKASLDETLDRAFTADFIVNSGAGMWGGVDPELAAKLADLPEVKSATGIKAGSAVVNDTARLLFAVNPATAFDIVDVDPIAGELQAMTDPSTIAVHEDEAKDKGLSVGDTVPVTFKDTGRKYLRVALIYGEEQPAGDYFIGTATHAANFADDFDMQVWVKSAEGVSTGAAMAAVEKVTAAYPGTDVLDQQGIRDANAAPLDQMLTMVYALLGLAIIIALMGIGNTLALSIFERTRELGLMRAVGMTRSQLRQSIRWESVIIALQGTVLGLLIGVFFGWVFVKAMDEWNLTALRIPWSSLAVVVVLAAIAGMVAAILPSRRAAKLDILRAVVSD